MSILSIKNVEAVQKMIWIGGWASPMGCWRSLLGKKYPGIIHEFYDIADLLLQPNVVCDLEKQIRLSLISDSKYPSVLLIGWSTGSLWIHDWMKQQSTLHWKGLYVHSVSPVFNFCTKEPNSKGWPVSIVNRMIKFIKRSQESCEGVLKDFWTSMNRDSSQKNSPTLSKEIEELWWQQAQTFSEEQLVVGLEFLRDKVVDRTLLENWKEQWSLYIDKKDPIAIWDPNAEKDLSNFQCVFHDKGHVPFFD